MRIVSWNVNGLYTTLKDASVRYASASSYFTDILKAQIICFQEAKIQEEKLEKWMACVPGYDSFWAFSVKKKGYSGVVTYVKEEVSSMDAKADCLVPPQDPSFEELCTEGRLMETDQGSFVLLNVYVPNSGDRNDGRPRLGYKMQFLKALRRKCDELVCSGKHVVIVGDFNIAHKNVDVHRQWEITDIFSTEEIAWMDDFLTNYVDLFRHFHPDEKEVFSVWDQATQARIHNEGLRIDYTICDKGFVSEVLDANVVKMFPKNWSDHAALVLDMKDPPLVPKHKRPELSAWNIRRFQEDRKQKKVTSLFSCAPKLRPGKDSKYGVLEQPSVVTEKTNASLQKLGSSNEDPLCKQGACYGKEVSPIDLGKPSCHSPPAVDNTNNEDENRLLHELNRKGDGNTNLAPGIGSPSNTIPRQDRSESVGLLNTKTENPGGDLQTNLRKKSKADLQETPNSHPSSIKPKAKEKPKSKSIASKGNCKAVTSSTANSQRNLASFFKNKDAKNM